VKSAAVLAQHVATSAKSPAPSTSIEAPPSTDVLALNQLLRKLETALAVQLQTGKNGFRAFLYQAHVPSVTSPLCSCGRAYQTAKHNIIHCCNCSAARHALRDDQGRLPDYKQLVTTPTGLKKVTKWVFERGCLASTRGPGTSSTLLGLLPQPTTELDYDLGTTGNSKQQEQQVDKQEEEGLYSPEGFPSLHVTR
jgi:hypothetical protein